MEQSRIVFVKIARTEHAPQRTAMADERSGAARRAELCVECTALQLFWFSFPLCAPASSPLSLWKRMKRGRGSSLRANRARAQVAARRSESSRLPLDEGEKRSHRGASKRCRTVRREERRACDNSEHQLAEQPHALPVESTRERMSAALCSAPLMVVSTMRHQRKTRRPNR